MKHDPIEIKKFFDSLTREQIQELNEKNHQEHIRQSKAFEEGYSHEICYLCAKPFKTISNTEPCLHWLLRRCKFRKKDFSKIFSKYSYHNIAAFLRWCANQECFMANINDLEDEKTLSKVISYTIKWKNIEWTFDCSKNDFLGHKDTKADFPHYHFQMRIDGKRFIDFNDFHIPLTDEDVFHLSLKNEEWVHHNFGSIGSGMQDAVSIPVDDILEHANSVDNESDATYHFSTMIEALDSPLSGDEIYEMQQEAQRTGKSFALIAQQRLQGRAKVQTVISPAENIPDIAKRTEHKKR
jgi:hypothetical protein